LYPFAKQVDAKIFNCCHQVLTVSHLFLNIVGWLITHWKTMEKEATIKEDSALSFAYGIAPTIDHHKVHEYLAVSDSLNF